MGARTLVSRGLVSKRMRIALTEEEWDRIDRASEWPWLSLSDKVERVLRWGLEPAAYKGKEG